MYWHAPPAQTPKLEPPVSQIVPVPGHPLELEHAHDPLWHIPVQTPGVVGLPLQLAPGGQSALLVHENVAQSLSLLQVTPSGTLHETRPGSLAGLEQSLSLVQLICEQ